MSRRNVLLFAGVCVLVVAAWFQLLWGPQGRELDDARGRRETAEAQVQQLRVELARLQDAQEAAPATRARAEHLARAVPETPSLPAFLLAAHEAAASTGVDWLTITPSQPAAPAVPGAPAEIRVSMEVKAKYFNLLDYLDRVLALDRLLVIDSLQLSPEGAGSEPPQLTVSLSGRLFTTAPPEVPAAAVPDPATDGAPPVTTTVPASNVAAPALQPSGGSR